MKISVIIPCHNCGPWVAQSLQSVSEQNYRPHEIIVINDGSTDDSVDRFVESGVSITLLHTHYGNAAAARNEGARLATGDWLAFLDADCTWLPHHLAAFRDALAKSPNDVTWFSILHERRPDGAAIPPWRPKAVPRTAAGLTDDDFLRLRLEAGSGFGTPGIIMAANRFHEIGGFDETQKRRHDFDLFMRAVKGHTWSFNIEETWYATQREGGLSSNRAECAYYKLRACCKNLALYDSIVFRDYISGLATIAVGAARRSGTLTRSSEVWALARRHLPLDKRIMYELYLARPRKSAVN